MSALVHRARRVDPHAVDALAAAVLALALILEASLAQGVSDRLATVLFAVPFAAPIAVRRRYPAAAVIGISVVLLLQEPFHGQLDLLPTSSWVLGLILCGYGAGACLELRPSLMSAATSRRPARRDIPDRRRGHRRLEWGAGRADRVLHASVAGGSLRA